jgi:hypothetical protein
LADSRFAKLNTDPKHWRGGGMVVVGIREACIRYVYLPNVDGNRIVRTKKGDGKRRNRN